MKWIVTIVFTLATAASSTALAQSEPTSQYAVNHAGSKVGFTITGSMLFKFKRDGEFKDFNADASGDRPTLSGEQTSRLLVAGVTYVSCQALYDENGAAFFETTFPIDRTAFGINGNPGYGGMSLKIAKNVQIHLAIATAAIVR